MRRSRRRQFRLPRSRGDISKSHYPKLDISDGWNKIDVSQELSDILVEELYNNSEGKKNMYRDEDLRKDILFGQRVSIQAAAYTVYLEITPNNKKQLTPREFRDKFIDNWEIFGNMENKEVE